MSDQADNMILILLRRIDERLERLEREVARNHTVVVARLNAIDARLGALEEAVAEHAIRLDRIERHLDLTEATHR